MAARLQAISGPLEGRVFLLGEADFNIGRGPGNDACLDDPSVSRKHACVFRTTDGFYIVHDRGGPQGTFVNGFFFPAKILVHGDRIRIGISIFIYLNQEDFDPEWLTLTPAERAWNQRTLPTERAAAYEAAKAAVLEEFVGLGTSINSLRSAEVIQARVIELIFRVIPVERVAILLTGHDRNRFVSTTYRQIASQSSGPFSIDETITGKVLREGEPVCQEKILCCPLTAQDTKVGVIYGIMAAAGVEYVTSGHMRLMESIAGPTALALDHAQIVAWLEGETQRLTEVISGEYGMIGQSEKMKEVYPFIAKAARSELPVLISGESGTGKELLALAIYQNSPRRHQGFFTVNCGTLRGELLLSELFGHEKGAFTGAYARRKGLFETAHGGTVFLDEIGEIPMAAQVDLLRVLEYGKFKRLGGSEEITVDIRVIAATNVDLQQAIKEGRFRPDLFFRLNVLPIEMPRLASRREDIPPLAAHFIKKHHHLRQPPDPPVLGITPEAHHLLVSYSWPGNVRQLENAIERALSLGTSPYIRPEDLPNEMRAQGPEIVEDGIYDRAFDDWEKSFFEGVLKQVEYNRRKAALRVGRSYNYFNQRCRDLNIKCL